MQTVPQGLLLDEKKTKSSIEEQFNRIDARHRKKKKRQEKYSWMSLGWLRFFGTSVNKEEKENSCGLRAEKFFARTKHSSSRLHSSQSKDNVLPVNHANDVGRVQEIRKTRIFGTCRILDWMRKFNFLDDEKVIREKGKIEAGHRTSPLHKHFFCASLFKCFFWSTQLSRFEIHNVFRFIFSHGKINWKAFNTVFEDFSLSWSFCTAKCW